QGAVMNIVLRLLAIFLVASAFQLLHLASATAADSCDPEKILRENLEVVTLNREAAFAMAESEGSISTKKQLSAFGLEYEGLELNNNDRKYIYNAVSKATAANWTAAQRDMVLRRTLSDSSVEAYKACLQQMPVAVEFTGDPTTEPKYGVI